MRQMSPMLQARIAQQQEIKIQQNNNAQQIDLSQKPDTVELSTKKEENKKGKILKIAAISAAIITAIAGGFIAAKKGLLGKSLEKHANNLWNNITSIFNKKTPTVTQKPQTPDNEPQKTVANIKKFINNGSEIEGVKLEKGKAVLANGSMFSGTMETVTKSGKKVAIDYENGLMTKSTINDKVFKTYEAPTRTLDRTKGTLIRQYDETGKKLKQSYHFYGDDSKISKYMSQNTILNSREYETGNYNVLEFSPNGKKIAEYETRPDFRLEKGKIFNEDGSIKKEFKCTKEGFICNEKTYLPDGTSKEKIRGKYVFNDINDQLATKELVGCDQLKLYDKDGKQTKWILANNVASCHDGNFEVRYGDNLDNSIQVTDTAVNNLYHTPEHCKNRITIDNEDTVNKKFVDSLTIKGDGTVKERNPHTKHELEKVVTILADADKTAKAEGMYEGRILSADPITKSGFDKIIQQLKDYVSKL